MNRVLKRIGTVLAVLVAILGAASLLLYILKPRTPKPPRPIDSINTLEEYFEQVVAAQHPPGLSVAVVKDGEILYANGFGTADGPRNVGATKDTVYHWWSMTKIPTAVAVMQLQEKGLLHIDDPVADYLPFFTVTYQGSEQAAVTIRQLLNHSAGMSNAAPEIFTWLHQEGDPPLNQTELVVEKFPDCDELLLMGNDSTIDRETLAEILAGVNW